MKRFLVALLIASSVPAVFADEVTTSNPRPVPYPEGYRQWRHVCSVVLPAKKTADVSQSADDRNPAPHGLLFNVYANEKAQEGYRTGTFPEGAVLIADWFFLEPQGPSLVEGTRKSLNVMIRDARYANTGGWGFEDFNRDSHTARNVGTNAVKACFECHSRAKEHQFVFSSLRP